MLSIRLKHLRKQKKLTQKQLAEKINVTHVSISGYESGNRSPDTDTLQKLADFFEVSIDYLLGRTNTTVKELSESQRTLDEVAELTKEYGFEQFGFFDIEKWKNLSPDDLDEIRRHFEWVSQKAKERNEEKK